MQHNDGQLLALQYVIVIVFVPVKIYHTYIKHLNRKYFDCQEINRKCL